MKARFQTIFDRLFYKPQPLPPGNYQTMVAEEGKQPYRMHLRIEKDSSGLLILNAQTVLHLNLTATEFAYHLIKNTPSDEVIQSIEKRYQISEGQAAEDFKIFQDQLSILRDTPDLDPETFLDMERVEPHTSEMSAPLRLDCALTYKLSDGNSDHLAPTDRVKRELDTEEWEKILDSAWNLGIPHIIFTGGEPSLRPDLIDLIAHAEQLGQVTGLLTDGLRLTEKNYMHHLLQSGLDHLLILLNPEDDQSWEALKDALAEDIFVTVHLTISRKDVNDLPAILEKLKNLSVHSISISTNSEESLPLLKPAQNIISSKGFSLVWDLPVPYSINNPIRFEMANVPEKSEGAGKSWLYIEPDGDVLPGQGIQKPLGNALVDPFPVIWEAAKSN